MVSWGPWNYRINLNMVSCGEFPLVNVQKIWLTPNFHNSEIFGILCHQVDIFSIFCSILTIDFSGPWNYRKDLNTLSCGEFPLVDVQKKMINPPLPQ